MLSIGFCHHDNEPTHSPLHVAGRISYPGWPDALRHQVNTSLQASLALRVQSMKLHRVAFDVVRGCCHRYNPYSACTFDKSARVCNTFHTAIYLRSVNQYFYERSNYSLKSQPY